jgi:hypothetical protein
VRDAVGGEVTDVAASSADLAEELGVRPAGLVEEEFEGVLWVEAGQRAAKADNGSVLGGGQDRQRAALFRVLLGVGQT